MHIVEPLSIERFGTIQGNLAASVVVVTWRWDHETDRCLSSLNEQDRNDFEVLVVDNGAGLEIDLAKLLPGRSGALIALPENRGPSLARNVATEAAQARVVIFLDDDAEAAPDFVAAHLRVIDDGAVAVRGRVEPKTNTWINRLARTYDLGSSRVPATLNVEGNTAILRDALIEVGGFDPTLFGFEGTELTIRLLESFAPERIVYDPGPMIRHSYADSVSHYLKKSFRHGRMRPALEMAPLKAAGMRRASDPEYGVGAWLVAPIRWVGRAWEVAGFVVSKLVGQPKW